MGAGGQKDKEIRCTLCMPSLFLACLFVLLECILHVRGFGLTGRYVLNKVFFAALFGYLAGALISFLPVLIRRIVGIFISTVGILLYTAQLIYFSVFSTYLSLSGTAGVTGQALDYTHVIFQAMKKEWLSMILLVLMIALSVLFFVKWMPAGRPGLKGYLIRFGAYVLAAFGFFLFLRGQGRGIDTPYDLFRNYNSVDLSVQRLGILDSTFLDIVTGIRAGGGGKVTHTGFSGEERVEVPTATELEKNTEIEQLEKDLRKAGLHTEEPSTEEEIPEVKVYGPNILEDVDPAKLAKTEEDGSIRDIHNYVAGVAPTIQNEYTGMFSGYNLIFITAEGFDGLVIDPERTPMLYKMSHEGFYFKNFYTPLWYGSTSGGEYANLTGLIPRSGGYLSMARVGFRENSMPFTLGNQLGKMGYAVYGFHNGTYDYYDRNYSHPVIGYHNWIASGSGFTEEKTEYGYSIWPQSDAYLESETIGLYVNKEPFHAYYMTISGHLPYSWGGNAMAARHKSFTENLPYSETTRVYLSCQYEVELMLERLYQDLKRAGVLDRTLIVLSCDHVPYDDLEILDELAGHKLERTFEVYKNTLIVYSASMESPVVVDKYCSSPDILPTISNLMGLPYDSRMMAGQDILSDSPALVVFQDHSLITDVCRYNASTGEVTETAGVKVSDDYLESIRTIAANRIRLSDSICEYDYYRYLGIDPE